MVWQNNIDLALECVEGFSEVRVAPRDQENITEFVGMFLKQNLHRHFCSESHIYYDKNSATCATTPKWLKKSDITAPEKKEFWEIIITDTLKMCVS